MGCPQLHFVYFFILLFAFILERADIFQNEFYWNNNKKVKATKISTWDRGNPMSGQQYMVLRYEQNRPRLIWQSSGGGKKWYVCQKIGKFTSLKENKAKPYVN